MDSVVLRVTFGHTIEKRTLPSGIPETMEELHLAVRQTLKVTDDFSLQYLDLDFEDFFTLHSTTQIKNKASIKVVTTDPVILSLYPVAHNESYTESVTSEQSFDAASTSATAQDSLTLVVYHLQPQSSCHHAAAWKGSHGQLISSFHDSLLKLKWF